MSVIRKEIKKLVYLSAYFYKVSEMFFFLGGRRKIIKLSHDKIANKIDDDDDKDDNDDDHAAANDI